MSSLLHEMYIQIYNTFQKYIDKEVVYKNLVMRRYNPYIYHLVV